MFTLALVLGALTVGPAPASTPSVLEHDVVLVVDPFDSAGFEEALALIAGVAAPDQEIPRFSRLEVETLIQRPAGTEPGLQCYRLGRHLGARQVWRVHFTDVTGWLAIRAFDLEVGVEVLRMTKVRSVAGEALEDEHRDKIRILAEQARDQLEEKRAVRGRQDNPYEETAVWRLPQDRTQYGFFWNATPERVTVSFVVPESSMARGGLQAGDVVTGVNDHETSSPAAFGRWLGPLQPGDALKLQVRRDDEVHEIDGQAESSHDLVPRSHLAVRGRPLDKVVGTAAATRMRIATGQDEGWPAVTVILVLRGVQENTLWDLSVLHWLLDQHDEGRVRIVGVATEMDAEGTAQLQERLHPDFTLVPDPDRALMRQLRVFHLPSLVVLDAEGRVRYRPLHDVALHHAVKTLLEE